jgi:hypothetical protein
LPAIRRAVDRPRIWHASLNAGLANLQSDLRKPLLFRRRRIKNIFEVESSRLQNRLHAQSLSLACLLRFQTIWASSASTRRPFPTRGEPATPACHCKPSEQIGSARYDPPLLVFRPLRSVTSPISSPHLRIQA